MRHVTVEDAALQTFVSGPWWVAHEHPERPSDRWTVWDWGCDPCMIHLVVSATHVTPIHPTAVSDGHVTRHRTLSETVALARAWRARNGHREI